MGYIIFAIICIVISVWYKYYKDHHFPMYVRNINVTNLKKIDERLVYKYLIDEGHISEIYQHQKRIEEWHRRYPQKFGKDNVAYRFQFIRRYSTGKVVIDSMLTADFDYIVEHICERTLVNTNLKTIEFPATYELLEMDKAEAKAKLNRVYLEQNKKIEKETENRLSEFNSIYGELINISKEDITKVHNRNQIISFIGGILLICTLSVVSSITKQNFIITSFNTMLIITVWVVCLVKSINQHKNNLAMVDYIARQKSKYSYDSTATSRLTEVFKLLSSDEDIDLIEKELKKKYEKQVVESELNQLKIENLKLQNESISIDNEQKKFWTCNFCGNMNRADDMSCIKCGGIRPSIEKEEDV